MMRAKKLASKVAVLGLGAAMCISLAACSGGGSDFVDEDGDGWAPPADCDDANAAVHPLAVDEPYNGVDEDCVDGDLTDVDRDGYDGQEAGGTDCDDGDARRFPGNAEVPYDGIDQDCDGNDLIDVDGDDHNGLEANGDDCDDTDPDVYPGAVEIPGDGIDQDCDGEDIIVIENDADGDGFVTAAEDWGLDCDDTDPEIYPGAPERCNMLDDDCDGETDEGLTDWDIDGHPACRDCDDYDNSVYPGAMEQAYDGEDQDCDGLDLQDVDGDGVISDIVIPNGDCDDNDPTIYPGATETCDNKDNDCNGIVDDGISDADSDGDGVKDCLDCAPNEFAISPNRPEVPGDSMDNDCDGLTDETNIDSDNVPGGDLQGLAPDCCDAGDEASLGCDPLTRNQIHGAYTDPSGVVVEAAPEIYYDGIDQDCDGSDVTDADGDGHDSIMVAGGDDCDDANPEAYPGHEEVCQDPSDNDCDGTVNEDCGAGFDEDVEVPGALFTRGLPDATDGTRTKKAREPDQSPAVEINMSSFYIDKYEVTISQYRRCVAAGACLIHHIDGWGSASDPEYWFNQDKGLHPALFVTWDDAQAYCAWVGKQLPTEAQWEMAARGALPNDRIFPWGDPEWVNPSGGGASVRQPVSCDLANHAHLCTQEMCVGDVTPADEYPGGVSPYGAYNMAGNVSEWVDDWYSSGYYDVSPLDDPPGPATGTERVYRGGSFSGDDYEMESVTRRKAIPSGQSVTLGFRCARMPPEAWQP
ncbi:MAG: SUMF1/EgtB/PvdO family nonheme iron enzyme [Deltaproteobacteria bacterium]|nr:SUMF1/EgtB/PvdO family nonheme iron enzyme [Deltaproteobacteria bacterium]